MTPDLQPQKIQTWRTLYLRQLLGGLVGIGISSLLYLDFLTGTPILPVLLEVPFIGQYYILNYLIHSPTSFGNYSILVPTLLWGLIGALITSGNKQQVVVGRISLIIYLLGGVAAYFAAALLLVIS